LTNKAVGVETAVEVVDWSLQPHQPGVAQLVELEADELAEEPTLELTLELILELVDNVTSELAVELAVEVMVKLAV
jgi:hypothetical protein